MERPPNLESEKTPPIGWGEWFLLTGFGTGLIKKAPGTWGSLVGLGIGALVIYTFPTPNLTLGLLAVLTGVVGVELVNRYEKKGGIHDDKRIVIDEIAGILVGLTLFRWGEPLDWLKMLLIFIGFRIMDIWKPSIIGKVDREAPGGWGVVGDDLLAGIFGGLVGGVLFEGILLLPPNS
ncbi:MAG: phosphatidylglycerophosphatase A [Campylobacterales bacterium]